MLPSLMIFSLGLLLRVSYSSTNSRATVDLELQPDYLKKNERSSIDYETCHVNNPHDYEDDKDYSPGQVCYYTHYAEKRIEEEFPGVRSCCPFHGHISSAKNCQGRDKDGNQVLFNKAEVCVKPIEGQDNDVAEKINLDCKGTIVKGIYEDEDEDANLTTDNGIQVLHVGQKTFTNFCFGIKCDGDLENFEHQYEACDETSPRIDPVPLNNGTRCCGKMTDQAFT